jgi:hypothetical protein
MKQDFSLLDRSAQCYQREARHQNINKIFLRDAVGICHEEEIRYSLSDSSRLTWWSYGRGRLWKAFRYWFNNPRRRKYNPTSPMGLWEMEREVSDSKAGRVRDISTIPTLSIWLLLSGEENVNPRGRKRRFSFHWPIKLEIFHLELIGGQCLHSGAVGKVRRRKEFLLEWSQRTLRKLWSSCEDSAPSQHQEREVKIDRDR